MSTLFIAAVVLAGVNVESTAIITQAPREPWCKYEGAPAIGDEASIRLYGVPSATPDWPYEFFSGYAVLDVGQYVEYVTSEYREGSGLILSGLSYGHFEFHRDGSPGTVTLPPEWGDWPSADPCIYQVTTTTFDDSILAGDSNRDGLFDSGDLVQVFIAGQYEDGVELNSTWDTGDWSADGEFSSTDLVIAFQTGQYEQPATAVPVPEPGALLLGLIAAAVLPFCNKTETSDERAKGHGRRCPQATARR